ncbi:MAG: hypothetical protein QOD28_191 [Acidobacteriota bacterium]|nr:hypothetical protein [Acidobacteriota bacterium]
MSGARESEMCARGKVRIVMSTKRTHTNSTDARGRSASRRTCAGLFSAVCGGAAAVLCPGALPTYLPGGELMREGANSTINLWNSDRRVSLI